jgi:hypothetical protein
MDAVAQEGVLERDEEDLPEAGVGDDVSPADIGQETGDEAGKFIDIAPEKLKKLKVKELRDELKKRGLSVIGNKVALFDRLTDALQKRVVILSHEAVAARATDDVRGFASTAKWIPLDPIPVPLTEPINVSRAMRAPTIPEGDAEFVPQKFNYAQRFDREPFLGSIKVPILHRNGKHKRDGDGKTIHKDKVLHEGGAPRPEFIKTHKLNAESKPQDWFNAFLPVHNWRHQASKSAIKCWSHQWCQYTNMKAILMGAGTPRGVYPTFTPFSFMEIERHLALYFMQGLNPSPQVEFKFASQTADPIQGNDLCFRNFGKGAVVRHKQFKAFFCITDPSKATPSRTAKPNHKVDTLLRHVQQVSMSAWKLGRDIAADEQTIGFQGNHRDKRRITYKAEGDGFQCDAICQNGFTYTFYFRNQPAPKKYLDQGLSPLHSRIMGMFDQLDTKFHNCWFDNLYLSAKFARAAYIHPKKVRISGPTRKSGRGLPKFVLQEEVKNPSELRTVRGTVRAAVLEGDEEVPNLVAVSYYDAKPVHFLSTICESILWIQLERKVYCVETGKVEIMKFMRLNINDAYNHDMGHVDISDQLRNYYRFDHWMRKRKWWWSLYFWAIGVLLVNSYVCYKEYCGQEGIKPMSHYEYRKCITLAWIEPDTYWPDRYKNKNNKQAGITESAISVDGSRKRQLGTDSASVTSSKKRAVAVNDDSMDPRTGKLRNRLIAGHGLHMPEESTHDAKCGLHFWATRERKRGGKVLNCSTCKVSLCINCFKLFHTVQEADDLKALFQKKAPPTASNEVSV